MNVMTPEELVYAETLNLFGSDLEPPEIDAVFAHLREDAVASHGTALAVRTAPGEDTL